jgi:hypothetical protein
MLNAGERQLVEAFPGSVIWELKSVGTTLSCRMYISVTGKEPLQPTKSSSRISIKGKRFGLCTLASISSFYYLTPQSLKQFPLENKNAPKVRILETQARSPRVFTVLQSMI